jgi:acetyl-CoA acetyltransferase
MRGVWIRVAAMIPFGKHMDGSAQDLVEGTSPAALSGAELAAGDVQFVYVASALAGAIGGQECVRAQTLLRRITSGLHGRHVRACAAA